MKKTIIILLILISTFAFGETNAQKSEAIDTSSFIVYPNPIITTGFISFNLLNSDTCSLQVYNINGQIDTTFFQDSFLLAGQYSFEYYNEVNGIYFLSLYAGNQRINKKIVVQNDTIITFAISPTAFTEYTTVEINLPEADTVNLTIYNRWGQVVPMGFPDTLLNYGFHSINIYAYPDMEVGVYVYLSNVGNKSFNGSITKIHNSSIPSFEQNNISIKPNPAKDYVIIEFTDNLEKDIQITNQVGQIVFKTKNNKQKNIEVNTRNFAKGIYFVSVISNSKISTSKLVINN